MDSIMPAILPVINSIPTPWYTILAFYVLGIVGLVVRIMSKCPDASPAAMWAFFLTKTGSLVKQSLSWLLVYGIWISMRWWELPPVLDWLKGAVIACTWRGAYWAAPFVAWLADSILRAILGWLAKLVADKTGQDVPVDPPQP